MNQEFGPIDNYIPIFALEKCGLHLSDGFNFGRTLKWQIFQNLPNLAFHY
jgi:hypothetical protein